MKDQQCSNSKETARQIDPQLVDAVAKALRERGDSVYSAGKDTGTAVRYVDPVKIGAFVLRKWWIVMLLAVVCGIAAGYVSMVNREYVATAKVFLAELDSDGISTSDISLVNGLKADYLEVFKVHEVHEMVRDTLGLTYTDRRLEDMVSATIPSNAHVVYVSARSHEARLAADMANAYAESARKFVQENMHMQGISMFSPALVPEGPGIESAFDPAMRGFLLGCVLAMVILCIEYRKRRSA